MPSIPARTASKGYIPYFLVGQDAAGRKLKPTPRSPQMLLGKQPQARNHRLAGLPRRNRLTERCGMAGSPKVFKPLAAKDLECGSFVGAFS